MQQVNSPALFPAAGVIRPFFRLPVSFSVLKGVYPLVEAPQRHATFDLSHSIYVNSKSAGTNPSSDQKLTGLWATDNSNLG